MSDNKIINLFNQGQELLRLQNEMNETVGANQYSYSVLIETMQQRFNTKVVTDGTPLFHQMVIQITDDVGLLITADTYDEDEGYFEPCLDTQFVSLKEGSNWWVKSFK